MPLLSDLTNVVYIPAGFDSAAVAATATVTIATNATGDGVVGITIDGGDAVSVTPTAAATPTTIAAALAVLIAAEGTFSVSVALGVITLVDNTRGTAGNSRVLADVTTDSTSTVGLVQPAGGAAGVAGDSVTPIVQFDITSLAETDVQVPYEYLTGNSRLIRTLLGQVYGWELTQPVKATNYYKASKAIAVYLQSSI